MRERDGAVVRRDRVEVAVDDAHECGAVRTLVTRHDPLGRRVLRQVFWIVQVGRRPSRLPRTVEARIVRAGHEPFRFGELPVLDAHANGHDGGAAALFHGPVVRGLAGDRVQIASLHFAESGDSLPHAIAGRTLIAFSV